MLLWGLALSLLLLNALFARSFLGIDARTLVFILVSVFILFVLYHQLFFKEMYEVLIDEEQIIFSSPSLNDDPTQFPLYGKNQNYHFIIYPAIHYRFPIENECRGFKPTDRKTWCGNAGVLPQCNTPNDTSNCTIITDV